MKLITIDGPSASGKSSVSRMLAAKLGWNWVSTGAFYRGLALSALQKGLATGDEHALVELAGSKEWEVRMTSKNTEVYVGEQNLTDQIGGEEVGAMASTISQIPQVREALLKRQRDCYRPDEGLVAEGRDCGTVVFPKAPAKIYLTASPALRALRRSNEDTNTQEITQELQKLRDEQDSTRKVAPLRQAEGALHVDSSFLSLEEVVAEVIKFYNSSQSLNN